MVKDKFVESMLKELRRGEETNWEYIVQLVSKGDIGLFDVYPALKSCLEKVMPDYKERALKGYSEYWKSRFLEAKKAKEVLDECLSKQICKTVKFRGIELVVA